MIKLMVTRFNNETWIENSRWRENNNHKGCIYNSPTVIKENISLQIPIYVIEMNNDENKIMGIGKIKNNISTKRHKIYTDNNYNRYSYLGKRIDREDIKNLNKLEELEKKLFKGKGHLKRGQGITSVSYNISNDYLCYIVRQFN